ncbi:MAG: tetratricopeptide repeat protein [Chloroflexus sp.]|nr:tetratricopeptide repeat protein [Chloroflexus sp.]
MITKFGLSKFEYNRVIGDNQLPECYDKLMEEGVFRPAREAMRWPVKPTFVALFTIIVIACLVRLWFWYIQARSGVVPPGDPEEYYRAAVHLLHGTYHDTGKWLRPPAYPVLFAVLLWLTGMNVAMAQLLQAVVFGFGVIIFFWFGLQLFDQKVGIVTALLAALFVPLASYASSLYAEVWFITLLVGSLSLLDRMRLSGSWRVAFGAGMVIGLAALARAVGLYLIPLVALWLLWPIVRQRSKAAIAHAVLLVFALGCGAALVIGPWAVRNYIVHHRLIVSDTNGGVSMWYGTVQSEAEKVAGEQRLAAVSNLADRQSLALQMALDNILADPQRFLINMRFKIASLYGLQTRSYAVGDVISIDSSGTPVVQNAGEYRLEVTLIADLQYIAITLLAIAGFCLMPQPGRGVPALMWIGLATLLSAITIGHPRLRVPIVAVLLPFAAYTLVLLVTNWHQVWQRLRWQRGLAAIIGALVFLALIVSRQYLPWAASLWSVFSGRAALAQHDFAAAERWLRQAHDMHPSNPLRTMDLADLWLAQGQIDKALAFYRQAAMMEHRSLYSQAMRVLTARYLNLPLEAEAGLAAIDDYWRVGNDVFEWAWEAWQQPIVSNRIIPGDPLSLGLYAGFAPKTPDLDQGLWTLGAARIKVRGTCGNLAVRFQAPAGRIVTFSIDQLNLRQDVVATGKLQEVSLSLAGMAGCASSPPVILRITSPTSLLDIERAPWYTGAAVHEIVTSP